MKVDQEEAAYQEEQRRLAVERAYNLSYQDTDPARELKSAIILSRTNKEREEQIARKKMWDQMAQKKEAFHLEQQRTAVRKMEVIRCFSVFLSLFLPFCSYSLHLFFYAFEPLNAGDVLFSYSNCRV